MHRISMVLVVLLVAGPLAACGGDDSPPGGTDAGSGMDAGGGDIDAGPTGGDAGDGDDAGSGDDGGGGGDDGGGGTDGGGTDGGPGTDAGPGGRDGGPGADAGTCLPGGAGACPRGTMCLCCPLGGPAQTCLCTTQCMADRDCTDPARPRCQVDRFTPGGRGICTPMTGITCRWGAPCASPDTSIATPVGPRTLGDLLVGDLVYSVDGEQTVAVPITRINRIAVRDHVVVRVVLEDGAIVEMSPPHPTADGRTFADLVAGGELGGKRIRTVSRVAYEHAFTHDILPSSDTGTYFASGAQVGSTLVEVP